MNQPLISAKHVHLHFPPINPLGGLLATAFFQGAKAPAAAATPAPAAPAATIQPPRIGAAWEGLGGIYAGLMGGIDGQTDFHVSAGTAEAEDIPWGGYGHDEPGAKSDHDGEANTKALVANGQDHPAAEWAAALGDGGFYLPSRREIRLLWCNVPELFDKSAWYWTSTQYSAHNAWTQYFFGGNQYDNGGKSYEGRARAVRRLIL